MHSSVIQHQGQQQHGTANALVLYHHLWKNGHASHYPILWQRFNHKHKQQVQTRSNTSRVYIKSNSLKTVIYISTHKIKAPNIFSKILPLEKKTDFLV